MCERASSRVHSALPTRTCVCTHTVKERSEVAADERTHEVYEEQEKQVFVGLYVGSTELETHSEPAGVPVLMASAGSWGSRQTGKVGFRYQDRG